MQIILQQTINLCKIRAHFYQTNNKFANRIKVNT